jgi:hypothetical protein
MTIFNSILHVHVVLEKIIKNFSQSEAFMAPWQSCWIADRNNLLCKLVRKCRCGIVLYTQFVMYNSCILLGVIFLTVMNFDHANEHSCHVWSHLLQWFSRRRLKCLQTDGRQVMSGELKMINKRTKYIHLFSY